ncbi:TIMELESS-interacting protein [Nymphon striatum]|nr:TIMELESS-interacting protein [Nymphon striatum]
MDIVDLDMDDMFGPGPADEAIEDNRYNHEELGIDGTKNNTGEGKLVKVKRIIKNPQPKMDPDRLTSGKGIPALVKEFENVQFKGKGYEAADLDKLMQIIELWGHRMFPKLVFKDLLERVEKLGTKKPVQVCLNKIRQDMPFLDSDFVSNQDDDVKREGDPDSAFNSLKDSEDLNRNENEILNSTQNEAEKPPVIESKRVLTSEQKERMERNRLIAEQKRMARLKQNMEAEKGTTESIVPQTEHKKLTVENESEIEVQHTEEELLAMLDDDMEF